MDITEEEIIDTLLNNSEYHNQVAGDIVNVPEAAKAIIKLIEMKDEEEVDNANQDN